MRPSILGCPEASCTAGPGLSGQPRFLASTMPACGVAEEVLEGRAGWALEPQLPVWWAAILLLASSEWLPASTPSQARSPSSPEVCTQVGDISHSTRALHSLARIHSRRPREALNKLLLPCDRGFTLLIEALGRLKSKPLGKGQHLLSHGAFHVLGEEFCRK